jgi:hypothetical protein
LVTSRFEPMDPGKVEELLERAKTRSATLRRRRLVLWFTATGRLERPPSPRRTRSGGLPRRFSPLGAAAVAGAMVVIVLAVVLASTRGPSANNSTTSGHGGGKPASSGRPAEVLATISLNTYVEATLSRQEAAATAAGPSVAVWPSDVAVDSSPVLVGDRYLAVVAYGFDPTGHPVQVVGFTDGKWSVVAELPPPDEGGTASPAQAESLLLSPSVASGIGNDVQPAHITGRTWDFYVPLGGGGCDRGPVLSNESGSWRYIPFTGDFPTSYLMGGYPRFEGTQLVTDNDCAAGIPPAQRLTYFWSYDRSSGSFVKTRQQRGWPRYPGKLPTPAPTGPSTGHQD